MKTFQRISTLLIALLACALLASCGKSEVNEASSGSGANSTAPSSQTTTQSVPDLLEELKAENAAPSEFIELAKNCVETADSETARLLTQAIFEAQKNYPAQVAADYETANSNSDFSQLYSLDITVDLAASIQDESIRKTVEDSYANGFMLIKKEGYVFPIIDIGVYEPLFCYLTEADQASLEADITEFNKTL